MQLLEKKPRKRKSVVTGIHLVALLLKRILFCVIDGIWRLGMSLHNDSFCVE